MPTINRQQMHIDGAPFMREIKVNAQGVFSIALPPSVAAVMKKTHVEGKSRDEVVRAFDAEVKEFANSKTTVRRVILYEVEITCCIMRDGKCVKADKDIAFVSGTALALSAGVYDEAETVRSGGVSSFRYTRVKSSIPDGLDFREVPSPYKGRCANQLPHTKEREAFFAKIGASMEDMILALANVFKSAEQLGKFIETGKSPLALKS